MIVVVMKMIAPSRMARGSIFFHHFGGPSSLIYLSDQPLLSGGAQPAGVFIDHQVIELLVGRGVW